MNIPHDSFIHSISAKEWETLLWKAKLNGKKVEPFAAFAKTNGIEYHAELRVFKYQRFDKPLNKKAQLHRKN